MVPLAERVLARFRSARVIPLDQEAVREEAYRIVDQVLVSLEGLSDDLTLSDWFDDQYLTVLRPEFLKDLKDVRGQPVKFTIYVYAVRRPHDAPVGGLRVDLANHELIVDVNGNFTVGRFKQRANSAKALVNERLLHEVTHLRDVFHGEQSIQPSVDPVGYYNQPHEVRAFMQQIVFEVLRVARNNARGNTVRELFDDLLPNSKTWKQVSLHMNDANKAKIQRTVYMALDEKFGSS